MSNDSIATSPCDRALLCRRAACPDGMDAALVGNTTKRADEAGDLAQDAMTVALQKPPNVSVPSQPGVLVLCATWHACDFEAAGGTRNEG